MNNMHNTKKALEEAILYLRMYAADDEVAQLHGCRTYTNPTALVEEWIKNIRKMENGEE